MRSSRPERRFLVALPVVAVLAGCVQQGPAGVAVKALQTDIVFGLKVAAQQAVPPLANPVTPVPADSAAGQLVDTGSGNALPPQPPIRLISPRPGASVPSAPAIKCAPAAESAFPAQAATLSVATPPREGRYRWKEVVDGPGPSGVTGTVTFFIEHDIINVSPVQVTQNPVPAGAGPVVGSPTGETRRFTYDEVVHNADSTTTTTTYEVVTGAPQINQSQTVGPPLQAGTSDRGLSLVKVVSADGAGKVTATFTPTSAVLLLPLDVVPSQRFQSSGTSPDGRSLAVDATIGKRQRVDACGTIVDGWEVVSTQTFSSAAGVRASQTTYFVGTQIGALLTFVRKSAPDQVSQAKGTPGLAVSARSTESLGQLDPDPLAKP